MTNTGMIPVACQLDNIRSVACPGFGPAMLRVLVTGGNKGIGRALCRQLAADHGFYVLMGARAPRLEMQTAARACVCVVLLGQWLCRLSVYIA